MTVQLKIKNRDQMIWLGHMIGTYIRNVDKQNPWHITINGDHDSGKSLIALAIDEKFRPEDYPHGILSKNRHVADNLIKGPVLFRNISLGPAVDKIGFDTSLTNFQDRCSEGKVYVTSNLKRIFTGEFNRAADGLDSDILDIDIKVTKGRGSVRYITIVARDESLIEILSNSPRAIKNPNPKFSVPHPPA